MVTRIGPRLPTGRFYRNYSKPVKVQTIKASKNKTISIVKPLKTSRSGGLMAKIKNIMKRLEETKYHSEQLLDKYSLDWAIHTYGDPASSTPNGDILPLVPRIPRGDDTWQRIGKYITPTKCSVNICVSLLQPPVGGTPYSALNLASNDIYVVMYMLRPKTSKNYRQMVTDASATVPNDFIADLLDNGDGTSKPFGFITPNPAGGSFIYSNVSDLHRPINKEYWHLVKRKVVKLTKNQGNTTYDTVSGEAPNLGKSSWNGSMSFKLPKLIYDDEAKNTQVNGGYPTNCNMCLAIGAVLTNGNDSLAYNQGNISGVLDNPMQLSVRTHYYYKDD